MDEHQKLAATLGPEEQFASAMLVLLSKYAKTDSAKRREDLEYDLMRCAADRLRVREQGSRSGTVSRLVVIFDEES
jgi:hypothetical protein